MIPPATKSNHPSAANSDYPKFVADQVLTSDNLNDMFGYLDEQGRLTRTNLLGIGIVCGLEVETAGDGSSITITKGVGITSSGYLISVPEVKYTKRTTDIFDAVENEYYNKFVNVDTKTQMNLWELKQAGEVEGTTNLNELFLEEEKIVLIFVELLEENNKNCDPNSCDDKGVNVTVNLRPLLVEEKNVEGLLAGAGSVVTPWLTLPALSIRRFDVTATPLYECLHFFQAFQRILNPVFLKNTRTALSQSYKVLKEFLSEDFPDDPFKTLEDNFKFLNDGTITPDRLIVMQYYYDLFSDIIMAYDEFRKTGLKVIGMCCPDDIFPRHLLLGSAKPGTSVENNPYRHYFIPSPILSDQKKTTTLLRILFKKLVLLIKNFLVPQTDLKRRYKELDDTIRITPSKLADVPLSNKSIPYYYSIDNASDDLLLSWDPERYIQGISNRNLSYHGKKYNEADEDIFQPLLYDLEPYNFLRIEGHIGKPYQHAVRTISTLRNKNRLPFEIVALSADISAVKEFIQNLGKLLTTGGTDSQATLESLMGTNCHFNDLELLYDSIMAELTGKLSNEMKFFYDLNRNSKRPALEKPQSNVPQVPLLVKTDTTFNFTTNTIGHEFELYYSIIKDQPFISLQVFFQSFEQGGNTNVMDFVFKAVLYYVEMVYESVTTGLSNFNFYNFYIKYYTLIQTVRYIKLLNQDNKQFPLSEEENDHLDALLSITADSRMQQLYTEFLRRILQVKLMQNAGYYIKNHPGVQHKAGVPMGGTFILIYHEEENGHQFKQINPGATDLEKRTVMTDTENRTGMADVGRISAKEKERKFFGFFDEKAKGEREKKFEYAKKENTTILDHLSMMSSDVVQKLYTSQDKIVSRLEKSIYTEEAYADRLNVEIKDSPYITNIQSGSIKSGSEDNNQPGGSYLVEALGFLEDRKEDKLDEVMEDFANGAVIADFYLPYTCCSDCPSVQMIISGEPEKPGKPPKAIATADPETVTLSENNEGTTKLDGSQSKANDGKIKTFEWSFASGPEEGFKINEPGEESTSVTFRQPGNYEFELIVTDEEGLTASAKVQVEVVKRENKPPEPKATASPAELKIVEGQPGISTLESSGSKDPDGSIETHEWSLLSERTGATILTPGKPSTDVEFSQPGNYSFQLTVTDNDGAKASTTVSVTVSWWEETKKECGSLSGIIDQFYELIKTDKSENFKLFIDSYHVFKDIEAFYTKMKDENVFDMEIEKQVGFFIQQEIEGRLPGWIENLKTLIIRNPKLELPAMSMLKVHTQLTYYIACINDKDIGDGKGKMEKPLIALEDVLKTVLKDASAFTKEKKKVVVDIQKISEKERVNMKNNNEDNTKVGYLKLLNRIIKNVKKDG